MDNLFTHSSPIIIMVLCTIIQVGLIMLYQRTHKWTIISLSLIPITFFLLYAWIKFFYPPIETARSALRSEVIFSMSIAIHVLYCEICNVKSLYGRRLRD